MKKLLLLIFLSSILIQLYAQDNEWTSGQFGTYLDVDADRPANSISEGLNIGRQYNTNIQFATKTHSGHHMILFNAFKSETQISGSLFTTGNSRFANSTSSYGSGAGAISFVGNGGIIDFMISDVSTGENTNVDWGSPKLRIRRDGKIGIGLDPLTKFHIAQESGDWVDGIRLSLNTHSWDIVSDHDGERLLIVRDQDANSGIAIKNGNVGIGVHLPTYKLSVAGTISATEVKVSTTPNSDYVFESDYNLLPLHEVDSFIQQNKHLPDIPSAEEFKENGVGLGEMDNMLLRKIEELTLYVIEQQRELKELEQKNENQAKEIQELKTKLNTQ